jgi:hypothetical protein
MSSDQFSSLGPAVPKGLLGLQTKLAEAFAGLRKALVFKL